MAYKVRAINVDGVTGTFTAETNTLSEARETAKRLRADGLWVIIIGPDGKTIDETKEDLMFTARNALAFLAENPGGCSEHLMQAHGFPAELIAKLVEAGFATATTESIIGNNRVLDVKRIKITETGRKALADP